MISTKSEGFVESLVGNVPGDRYVAKPKKIEMRDPVISDHTNHSDLAVPQSCGAVSVL